MIRRVQTGRAADSRPLRAARDGATAFRRRGRTRRAVLVGAFALALGVVSPLHAHDAYTSWAETRLLPDRLELTLVLARSSALRLLPDSSALPPITPENFRAYAPRLQAIAADLIGLASAGKPLPLASAQVMITGDADITFHLVYPRPRPGELRFTAHYLFGLVDGHVGTLVLGNAAGKDLGWSPVSVDQPVFRVTLSSGDLAPPPAPK